MYSTTAIVQFIGTRIQVIHREYTLNWTSVHIGDNTHTLTPRGNLEFPIQPKRACFELYEYSEKHIQELAVVLLTKVLKNTFFRKKKKKKKISIPTRALTLVL